MSKKMPTQKLARGENIQNNRRDAGSGSGAWGSRKPPADGKTKAAVARTKRP